MLLGKDAIYCCLDDDDDLFSQIFGMSYLLHPNRANVMQRKDSFLGRAGYTLKWKMESE